MRGTGGWPRPGGESQPLYLPPGTIFGGRYRFCLVRPRRPSGSKGQITRPLGRSSNTLEVVGMKSALLAITFVTPAGGEIHWF